MLNETEFTDTELRNMSVEDLRALKERVDAAIRAHIARSRQAQQSSSPEHKAEALPNIDLERERDAWQARRR